MIGTDPGSADSAPLQKKAPGFRGFFVLSGSEGQISLQLEVRRRLNRR